METVAPKSVDRIAWRDIQALSADPYQPQNHRLQVIASTDLRWTSGVPFQANGEEGKDSRRNLMVCTTVARRLTYTFGLQGLWYTMQETQ